MSHYNKLMLLCHDFFCSQGIFITLFSCMVVLHSIFSIGYGSPLSYLHGKKLTQKEETDIGMNNE